MPTTTTKLEAVSFLYFPPWVFEPGEQGKIKNIAQEGLPLSGKGGLLLMIVM
jgi:hypothetical protein